MRDRILGESGKDYWRSVEEFADAPEFEEFVKREYPAHGQEWNDRLPAAVSLRSWEPRSPLPVERLRYSARRKIVPYVRPNDGSASRQPLFSRPRCPSAELLPGS